MDEWKMGGWTETWKRVQIFKKPRIKEMMKIKAESMVNWLLEGMSKMIWEERDWKDTYCLLVVKNRSLWGNLSIFIKKLITGPVRCLSGLNAKPDGLKFWSLIPRAHIVEGKNQLWKFSSDLHTYVLAHTCLHAQINKCDYEKVYLSDRVFS